MLAVAIPSALPIRRSPRKWGFIRRTTPTPTSREPGGCRWLGPGRPFPRSTGPEDLTILDAHGQPLSSALRDRRPEYPFRSILVWRGMGEAASAYLVSLYAFCSIPLAIGLGWMGDRWNKARLSSLCIVPNIVAMMGMVLSDHSFFFYFFPFAFAIAMGPLP